MDRKYTNSYFDVISIRPDFFLKENTLWLDGAAPSYFENMWSHFFKTKFSIAYLTTYMTKIREAPQALSFLPTQP